MVGFALLVFARQATMTVRFHLALLATVLACTPDLADSASPGEGWPDLGDPPAGLRDGRRDGALIIAIDDPTLGGRPGAWNVASGWWRYLVRTRGLRPARVITLRDHEATSDAIAHAVAKLELRGGDNSLLWFVFIGSGETPSRADGLLRTADGSFELADVRDALGSGFHESTFVLLDACSDSPNEGASSGLPAASPAPRPRFRHPPPETTPLGDLLYQQVLGGIPPLANARERAEVAVHRELGRVRNLFVISAGQGSKCQSTLADRPFPALAYAVLGGLQGWADVDDDGWVSATELAIYAQSTLADLDNRSNDETSVRIQAAGSDLILADLAGLGPRPAPIAAARRRSHALDPGHASQTDHSLARARDLLVLEVEDMVPVAPGSFWMGCDRQRDEGCEKDEQPQQLVELGGFSIDRTEVTWADHRACIDAGVCPSPRFESCWVWMGLPDGFVSGGKIPDSMLADDHPAMCVSWAEAAHHCEAVGKRLPTEAEWERAARGIDRRAYPWGDTDPNCKLAIKDGCSDFGAPVGSVPAGASPVGALDMAGNVAEWVFDWWDEHSYRDMRSTQNPTGPEEGEVRSVRGGSFYSDTFDLRTSYRYGLDPHSPTSIVGFRCAR